MKKTLLGIAASLAVLASPYAYAERPTAVNFGYGIVNTIFPSQWKELYYPSRGWVKEYIFNDDYRYVEPIPKPAGATTQWMTLTFKSENFLSQQPAGHVPIFMRFNDQTAADPPRGKGIFVGRGAKEQGLQCFNQPGNPAYIYTEVTASKYWNAPPPMAGGVRCSGAKIEDNVDYNLVMHVTEKLFSNLCQLPEHQSDGGNLDPGLR